MSACEGTTSEQGSAARPVLRRNARDAWLLGVCGGLGRHTGIDPARLRLVFAVLGLVGGLGVWLYLLLAIAIPLERPGDVVGPPTPGEVAKARRERERLERGGGFGLVAGRWVRRHVLRR